VAKHPAVTGSTGQATSLAFDHYTCSATRLPASVDPGHSIRRCKFCGDKLAESQRRAAAKLKHLFCEDYTGMVTSVPSGSSQHRSEHQRYDSGIFADQGSAMRRCMVHQGLRKPHLYLPRDYARPNAMQRVTHETRSEHAQASTSPHAISPHLHDGT